MNSKKVNYIVTAFNVVAIVAFCILYFSIDYIFYNTLSYPDGYMYVYNNSIINVFISNFDIILFIFYLSIGISNIVSSIQNRKDKKLSFWYFVFGAISIVWLLQDTVLRHSSDIIKYLDIVLFVVIPIFLAIKNFIHIKRDKPKKIKIFSYILAVVISVMELLNILLLDKNIRMDYIYGELWLLSSIVMQFIYIHFGKDTVIQSRLNKVVNIIIHYLVQFLVVISFLLIIIYFIIETGMWDNKKKDQISKLLQAVTSLKGNTISELYIPVENDEKFGFINEQGEEEIACEYDKVTYFYSIEINDKTYYFALVKKENDYYAISKSNDTVTLETDILSYFDNIIEDKLFKKINENNDNNISNLMSVESFDFVLRAFLNDEKLERQDEDTLKGEEVILSDETYSGKYYYSGDNYSMRIEPLDEKTIYNIGDDYLNYAYLKCRVTVKRADGEETSEVEYIQGSMSFSQITIYLLSDGYISFKSLDGLSGGWYDNYGYRVEFNGDYEVSDVKDGNIILSKYDSNTLSTEYFVFDSNGMGILQTNTLAIFENYYFIETDDGKFVLTDKNFNQISKEYDRIVFNSGFDLES